MGKAGDLLKKLREDTTFSRDVFPKRYNLPWHGEIQRNLERGKIYMRIDPHLDALVKAGLVQKDSETYQLFTTAIKEDLKAKKEGLAKKKEPQKKDQEPTKQEREEPEPIEEQLEEEESKIGEEEEIIEPPANEVGEDDPLEEVEEAGDKLRDEVEEEPTKTWIKDAVRAEERPEQKAEEPATGTSRLPPIETSTYTNRYTKTQNVDTNASRLARSNVIAVVIALIVMCALAFYWYEDLTTCKDNQFRWHQIGTELVENGVVYVCANYPTTVKSIIPDKPQWLFKH